MTARSAKEPPLPRDLQSRFDALACRPWDRDDDDASTHLTQLLADWKELGNACYNHSCFLAAIRCYTKLMALPGGDTAAIRSNRSAAYLQSSMHAGPALALKDAEAAVEMEPKWFKGHLRVADAQRRRGDVVEADAAYRRTLALQPTCEGAHRGLRALKETVRLSGAAPGTQTDATTSSFSTARGTSSASEHTTAGAARSTEAPPITQEQRLERWKRETSVREDRTGMRPRPVSLAEADRQKGAAIKQTMLERFRSKVETDETFSSTLRERREEEMMLGDGVDYRDGDKYLRVYAHSTNGIGLGISADAYKEHTGQVDHRTW
ncbi:hypothetical protein ABB37_05146 [Leptomonas pyrrhocoris]|uniref:Uncharacterized protein n=1 Tax=Leptomonas pyrrhocoris TaxID=157538 RepID=A0A0M9G1B3_LEPPY|nr:hypothetical protein ABB37_05146 [Leptomonas pyrrhocoris]XP_015658599.1 hypothetical protein ABB37_05146 [Leptomonas pyrrhocoris]KPA80159.1 hypothetical protein ABB37_05146 [Leptomonas pyrrhocoris]KPA80160.1 hypothetical protein ABB37_05146 [Leptomonas pyrrhocoris]|eukprot:XP_015658598.1 hypothetical protein ABB37_05146 [Leptomonas pyrrhocoris]